uniref:hypothetical protein n=1 Tax=Rheinheimera sp. TaxID=1869214 RepID=UPI004047AB00
MALVFFVFTLSDPEGITLLEKVASFITALLSVFIVTWSAGFWGNWKFVGIFAGAPPLISIDILVSGAIGFPPAIISLIVVVFISGLGVQSTKKRT